MNALVVGVGQPAAGDDGIGIFVARSLRARGREAIETTDPMLLVSLLADGRDLVVVDAVVGIGSPGDVLRLEPDSLSPATSPVSSHGIGVAGALRLARVVHGVDVSATVAIVAVAVASTPGPGTALSSAVAAAVAPAAALAEELASTEHVRLRRASTGSR